MEINSFTILGVEISVEKYIREETQVYKFSGKDPEGLTFSTEYCSPIDATVSAEHVHRALANLIADIASDEIKDAVNEINTSLSE